MLDTLLIVKCVQADTLTSQLQYLNCRKHNPIRWNCIYPSYVVIYRKYEKITDALKMRPNQSYFLEEEWRQNVTTHSASDMRAKRKYEETRLRERQCWVTRNYQKRGREKVWRNETRRILAMIITLTMQSRCVFTFLTFYEIGFPPIWGKLTLSCKAKQNYLFTQTAPTALVRRRYKKHLTYAERLMSS